MLTKHQSPPNPDKTLNMPKNCLVQKLSLLAILSIFFPFITSQSEPHPHPSLSSATNSTSQLHQKLEQVFGANFLKRYKNSDDVAISSSPEEFETVEDEYLEKTTRTSTIGLPGEDKHPDKHPGETGETTKFPILIPSEMDIVAELGDSVLSPEEENEGIDTGVFDSGEGNSSRSGRIKGRISTSAHFSRSCGDVMEGCEAGRPDYINFARSPNYCRCDRGVCDGFGDCCWTIAATLLYRNVWKCHQVQHENSWALMISKCSEEYKSWSGADLGVIKSCENPLTIPLSEPYTHLNDIPVVSMASENSSELLFRNIFCSQCNLIRPDGLAKLQHFLRCSKPFNSTADRQKFVQGSKYVRGKRIWVQEPEAGIGFSSNSSEVVACGIFSPELDPRLLFGTVPGIRYCKKGVIDKCPKDYARSHPLVAGLCNSYTQLVESRPGFLFKNPHCAMCYGLDPKWDLRCLKEGSGIKTSTTQPHGKITPGAAGASLDSTGLSLLFDFDLSSGGNYVGYENTCPGDTMWDFLRQRCTVTMCGKDYELDHGDGRCKLKGDEELEPGSVEGQETDSPGTISAPNPGNDALISNSSLESSSSEENATSSCYVLIVHDSEYIRLPNNSVLVTIPGSTAKNVIFGPEEYQVWNESSISICARELSSSFRQRFSPLLNYLSLSALGVSVFFSVLHIAIFGLLPKMRNLPGRNLFCLTLSLLISQFLFLSFITARVAGVCVVASIFMHYFFLASFFWMNVMSFDIWRTFSAQFQRHSASGNGGLFLKYSLWGWGSPLLILAISVSIDFFFAELDDASETALRSIRPLYGHNNLCWIGQGLALFLFFALPAFILIALNIFLFGWTAKAILKQSRDAEKVFSKEKVTGGVRTREACSRKSSSSAEAEVQRMKLYVKLGVIMGVTWILGFLSGISEWEWLWYPFVLVNGLQGTFIFFGFDAKPKVWSMLKERFGRGEGTGSRGNSGDDKNRNRRSTFDGTTSTGTSGNVSVIGGSWRTTSMSTSTSQSVSISGGNVGGRRNERASISHRIPI